MGEHVKITPFQQMVASCSGAVITSLFVTPLDVVKIRLQAQQKHVPKRASCFVYCNGLMDHLCLCTYCTNGGETGAAALSKQWYNRPGKFTGMMDAFVKITRHEGLRSLWSGLPPTLVMSVPATVFYFTTYDQLKYLMGFQEYNPNTQYIPMVAGSLARIGAVTLISPIELVRTKMQSEQLSYRQVGVAIRGAVEQGSILSLWKGWGPTILRDVPFSALYWFGYEYVKARQMKLTGSDETTFTQSFMAGAISGTVAAVLTLPFDVVKTHRQIELGEAMMVHETKVTSTWKLISRLYAQHGISVLFTGLVPRVIKVAPACAVMISTYEYGKHFFRTYNATHTLHSINS